MPVTVVVPRLKLLPLAGLDVTVGAAPLLSEAVGALQVTAREEPLLTGTLMLLGQVMLGTTLSVTVTVKVHLRQDEPGEKKTEIGEDVF